MTATLSRVHSGARLRDLVWVAWRQRRLLIVTTVALATALVAWSLWLDVQAGDPPVCVSGRPCDGNVKGQWTEGMSNQALMLFAALAAFSGLLAAFWGVPVVSREFEQRTYVWTWTQDVSLRRWLGVRMVLFGGVITLSSAIAGSTASLVWERAGGRGLLDDRLGFEFSPAVQLGYAVFGFALGLALGALTRHTQIALGLTTLVFAGTRLLIGQFARPLPFFTPLREVWPVTGTRTGVPGVPLQDTVFLSPGLLDRAGNAVSYDSPVAKACFNAATANNVTNNVTDLLNAEDRCFLDHGLVQRFFDYQPADRLATLRLTEAVVYLVLAAALFTLTWLRMRKAVSSI